MSEFMISLRHTSNDANVGKPRYLVIDPATGAETAMTDKAWAKRLLAGFPAASADTSRGVRPRQGDILFLVHGFNVSHAAAVEFHGKCAAGLAAAGWQGQVVSFDWPSDGLVFAYLDDRAKARAAASALVTSAISLLQSQQQDDCTVRVNVLAHSMGCFVTQQAFTWAYQDVPPDWRVGQVLLVAADVDASVFSASNATAQQFGKHAARLTAYRNRYDAALAASNAKRLELAPRLGRVGLPADAPSMMCEVDCTRLFEDTHPNPLSRIDPVTTHCFYFSDPRFWHDAALTLQGNLDRSVIPTRDEVPGPTPNRFTLKSDAGR